MLAILGQLAGRQSALDGRQFSAVRNVEKVLCFCLTLLAALHYMISLHCAARSASAFASAAASAVSQQRQAQLFGNCF